MRCKYTPRYSKQSSRQARILKRRDFVRTLYDLQPCAARAGRMEKSRVSIGSESERPDEDQRAATTDMPRALLANETSSFSRLSLSPPLYPSSKTRGRINVSGRLARSRRANFNCRLIYVFAQALLFAIGSRLPWG